MLALYFTYLDSDEKQLFEDIFYAYRKQMVFLALSILKNNEDAEDVVHDVFLKIATKHMEIIRAIQKDTDLRNYLLKATKHTALNLLQQKQKTVLSPDVASEADGVDMDAMTDSDFLDTLCTGMAYKSAVKGIKSLDGKYRDVLYYHFVLEMTVPQVAQLLGQTVVATKKQLVRGKKMLLRLLETEGVDA